MNLQSPLATFNEKSAKYPGIWGYNIVNKSWKYILKYKKIVSGIRKPIIAYIIKINMNYTYFHSFYFKEHQYFLE